MIPIEEEISPLLTAKWKVAKTMPYAPHEYTTRQEWADDSSYVDMLKLIDLHGVEQRWGCRTYRYLYFKEYKYWAMHGGDYAVSKIINRVRL